MSEDNDKPENKQKPQANELQPTNSADKQQESAGKQSDDSKLKQASDKKSTQKNLFETKSMPRMQSKKTKKKFNYWMILLFLLVILLALAIGWVGYQQYQANKSWQVLQQQLKRQMNDYAAKIQQAQQQTTLAKQTAVDNQQQLKQQSDFLQQINQNLTLTQQKIKQLSGREQQDWLVAEAAYLIQLAAFKTHFEKDKASAIILLKTADEKLLQTADNSLLPVRQAIAADISALEIIPLVDFNGIASEIQAISSQISKLEIIALEIVSEQQSSEENQQEKQQEKFSWSNFYRDFLDDFVVIKDHSEIKLPMTPQQRINLNSHIQLNLQQAQIALLRNQQSLYNLYLSNAMDLIKEFFKQNHQSKMILEKLKNLAQENINPQFPKKIQSKQAILKFNKQKFYQWLDKQPEQAAETKPTETSQ